MVINKISLKEAHDEYIKKLKEITHDSDFICSG